MAMNIHQEARRKQQFMDRVCEARRRLTLSQDDNQQTHIGSSGGPSSENVMCTDQGQFYQTRHSMRGPHSSSVHVWTGTERNRRSYDRSREGPILGQSWRALENEMKFREHSLSSTHHTGPLTGFGIFQPIDRAFPRK